jgi:hypothetical protein
LKKLKILISEGFCIDFIICDSAVFVYTNSVTRILTRIQRNLTESYSEIRQKGETGNGWGWRLGKLLQFGWGAAICFRAEQFGR